MEKNLHQHIVKSFDDELELLSDKLMEMGKIAQKQLRKTLDALIHHDTDLAELIIQKDDKVNQLQDEVDELIIKMLAMRQPMAIDLRNIISGLKISSELERIADYAANIANHSLSISGNGHEEIIDLIKNMASNGQIMLNDAMKALLERDIEKAKEVWQTDEKINEIYGKAIHEIRKLMRNTDDKANIKYCTMLLFIARCCERVGDHITNIAEQIVYIVTGEAYKGIPESD